MKKLCVSDLVPSSPMVITDELVHRDLNYWSESLLIKLEQELQDNAETVRKNICVYLNQAALISSLLGETNDARSLCKLQLSWLKAEVKVQGVGIDLFYFLLQPWINLGRLNHIEGKYAQAIPHVNMAESAFAGKGIFIDGVEISGDQIAAFLADPDMGNGLNYYLFINYIEGMVKVYSGSGNYLEGLNFIEEQKSHSQVNIEFLLEECELILLLKMGKYEEAWKCARQYKPQSPFNKLLLLYYTSLIAQLTGREEQATRFGLKLASYLVKSTKDRNFIDLKKLLLSSARLCACMNLGQSAHTLHQKGFELSNSLQDQRYAVSFGYGLSESNMISETERKAVLQTLQSHIAICHYRIREMGNTGLVKEQSPLPNLERLNQFIYVKFGLKNQSPRLTVN